METPNHLRIKKLMQKKFNQWFPGVKIKEYNFWGQRVDFFYINYQGITITLEVIWRTNKQGFLEDFDIIQNSLGQIKLVIVNLDRMKQLQLYRYFEKIRIAEIRKGFIVSEPFDGNKILEKNEKIYFEYIKEFIDFSLTLITTDKAKMDYHFSDIKKYVVEPLYEYITQNEAIPFSLEECEIDQGLFTDFMDNHYLSIKKIWNETKTLGAKSHSVKKKFNQRIEKLLKTEFRKAKIPYNRGIEYEKSPQDEGGSIQVIKYQNDSKIPIKEVVERLGN